MLTLTPQTIRILDIYDDGKGSKHYVFEPFGFKHNKPINIGQFFMLTLPGVGQAPFTYTSIPDKSGRFVALIRCTGKLTRALFEKKCGDVLGYIGPLGNGWPQNKLTSKAVLIVAGGCGLAPLASTIDYLIKTGQAEQTTVIYGANTKSSQILKKEREYWRSKLLLIETMMFSEQPESQGNPVEHIKNTLNTHKRQPQIVLTCGPEAMMRAVAKTCQNLSIDSTNIWLSLERRMPCGVGLCGHCYLADTLVCKHGPTYSYDQLVALENKTTHYVEHAGLFRYC